MMKISTTKAIRKSTTPARTEATGMTRRGKYTLVIMLRLLTRARPASVTALEKRPQGSRAVKLKTG